MRGPTYDDEVRTPPAEAKIADLLTSAHIGIGMLDLLGYWLVGLLLNDATGCIWPLRLESRLASRLACAAAVFAPLVLELVLARALCQRFARERERERKSLCKCASGALLTPDNSRVSSQRWRHAGTYSGCDGRGGACSDF